MPQRLLNLSLLGCIKSDLDQKNINKSLQYKKKLFLKSRFSYYLETRCKLYFLKINFLYILNCFDILISKITFFKKYIYYFNAFQYKKYFKKQPRAYSQTDS
jgi:hypothetical protein